MDHVKGAFGPLASMVLEFLNLLECKKPSEAARDLIPPYLESKLLMWGEDGICFIEKFKQFESNWQMKLNKELESPDLKRNFLSLYSKLTSLMREGDYTEILDRSEEVKVWAEARELSYDLDDVVENFLIYLQESHRLNAFPRIDTLKKLMQKMANLQLHENIPSAEMIEDVTARPESNTTINPNIESFYTEIPDLVGMSRNVDSLIHLISDDNVPKVISEMSDKYSETYDKFLSEVPPSTSEKMPSNDPGSVPDDSKYEGRKMPSKNGPKVACIVGFGGLGKTTLVRTLYDKMKKEFSCKAFVRVGQNANENRVLIDILLALDKEKKEKNYTPEYLNGFGGLQLTKELAEFLRKKRYLIVIDDIWKENSWEVMKCAFQNEGHFGSQVFTTTRSMSVANACCSASDGRLIYQMEPLSDEESSSLFYNRVFPQKGGQCRDDFKQVSAAILKKCGGVPLAIITVASLLASNGKGIKPISEWNHLLKSMGSGLTEGQSVLEMNRILSLSYADLPPELKNCLLYMVVFPEDYVIKKDHLVSKWIAEDLIRRTNQEDSLFEVAEIYFNMLINRSWIEPVNIDGEGKAKACRVHDMVLGFLCSLTSEANFVTIIDGSIRTTSNSKHKIRRLSIQNCMTTPQVFIPEHSDDMHYVRSFTLSSSNHVFDRTEETFYKLLCDAEKCHPGKQSLSSFEVLRVLDLRDCCPWISYHQTHRLQASGYLQLRYLGLKNTIFDILPTDIGKMKFLQILDLRNHNFIKELPPSIVELSGLIYLRVDPKTRLPNDFGKLTSLEKLTHVMVNKDSTGLPEQLGYLTSLRVLRITAEDMDENIATKLFNSLENMQEIRTLDFRAPLDDKNVLYPGDFLRCMEEAWKPSHLQKFWADNYYCFSVLPVCITESCYITSLSICLKEVQRKDIEILGRMQYLRYLNLSKENMDNKYPAQQDMGFQFENDAFPVARELHIAGIVTLPSMFPKEAMPKVQTFEIHVRLEDFGNLNLEIAHLPALKKMKVIIWYKIDVPMVTIGAQGSFKENYSMLRNYVHDVIGAQVKDADAALRSMAVSHPNRLTTDIETRWYTHDGDLDKNKIKLLMCSLKISEEHDTKKRIRSSEAHPIDVMVSLEQRIKEFGEASIFPSQPPVNLVPAPGEEMSPATSFREIVLARRGTRNNAKTTNDDGLPFAAKSHAQAVKAQASREPLYLNEIMKASGMPCLPSLDSDEANLKLFLSIMKKKEEEEILQEHRVVAQSMAMKIIEDIMRAAKVIAATNDVQASNACKVKEKIISISPDDVKSSRQIHRFTEIDENLDVVEIFQKHRMESRAKQISEERECAENVIIVTNDAKALTTSKGKEKIMPISSVDDIGGSCQPHLLTEVGEGSSVPSLPSLDLDKLEFLLSMLKNKEEEIFKEHCLVEESITMKLKEDRARAAKENAAIHDLEASATCKGKEKVNDISSNDNIKGNRLPLRLTKISATSGSPLLLSTDLNDDKLKNDEDEATEKQLISDYVEAVDVKYNYQELRLTKNGEASGLPSLAPLDLDDDKIKFERFISSSKIDDEEALEKQFRSSDPETINVKDNMHSLCLTEIREASGLSSMVPLDPDDVNLTFALLLSTSKNEEVEEIFQKYRVVTDSMATKTLAKGRECTAKGNAAANEPNPMPLPQRRIPTPPTSPRAQTLHLILDTRSAATMLEELSASGMKREGNITGLEVGIASSIIFQNTLPDAVMDDVAVLVDADVTRGEATSEVNDVVIVSPAVGELATAIAEVTVVGTAVAANATLGVAEDDQSKRTSSNSVTMTTFTSPTQLDSSREVAVSGQNLNGRLHIPYSSEESLDELEQTTLSAIASVRLAKEAVKYELDMSCQKAKLLALKNTDLDRALAAEKTQVDELKTQLSSTEKISLENTVLHTKLRESSELMQGLVRTNKALETKLEEAETKVRSAAQFQEKYKDIQILLERLKSKDMEKSKLFDLLKKEHEDLQAKYKKTIDYIEKLDGEMYEKL